jgi:mortality factor 4-like protein 1
MAGGEKAKGSKFSDNEKVLCYHGPLLYEAKCVKSRKDPKGKEGEFHYFVHYQGWNKNWDEWVGETRILKANADNIDRKGKLLEQHQVEK